MNATIRLGDYVPACSEPLGGVARHEALRGGACPNVSRR